MFAVQAAGSNVTTIEGVGSAEALHPMQEAFWSSHGLQCGYCTAGMIISSMDLLRRNPDPTDDEIREGIEGNLCRCTGYHNIIVAVRAAAKAMRERRRCTACPSCCRRSRRNRWRCKRWRSQHSSAPASGGAKIRV